MGISAIKGFGSAGSFFWQKVLNWALLTAWCSELPHYYPPIFPAFLAVKAKRANALKWNERLLVLYTLFSTDSRPPVRLVTHINMGAKIYSELDFQVIKIFPLPSKKIWATLLERWSGKLLYTLFKCKKKKFCPPALAKAVVELLDMKSIKESWK